MSQSLISVVLGSYNRFRFLKLTVDSIRKELLNWNYEIVVVDGGSTDGSVKWLTAQKDIITIIQHNRGDWNGKPIKRRSWGYFMNLGFKSAQGKYICMVSDDCLIVPGAIKNGYNLFEQKLNDGEKIGAVAFYWRNYGMHKKYFVMKTLGNILYLNHGLYLNKALQDVDYIDEENYFFYNGDCDLGLKLAHKGYKTITSENSYIEHFQHANLKLRETNYSKNNSDEIHFFNKWRGIFWDEASDNRGEIVEKEYVDSTKTGEIFNRAAFFQTDYWLFRLNRLARSTAKKLLRR